MKIPEQLPKGIQETLRLIEKAVKRDEFAVVESGDPATGERSFVFGVTQKDGKGQVVGVQLLCELLDATQLEDTETIELQRTGKEHMWAVAAPKGARKQ